MDDTFHKNNYNKAKAMQEYAAAILQQLPMIDRVRNFEELKVAIYKMLQLLGKCAGADRVYLFDKSKNGEEVYSERYEWCAPGIVSKAEECQWIPVSEIPVWDALLKKGEAFAIQNIEEVRQQMPKEYEMMKQQQIFSMIAAPIYSRNRLSGFIGMDNPYSNVSHLFIQQMTFVGAHLNTARENLRLFTFQEQSLQKMEKERQVLNVLCEDSTSVYKVNLLENQAEIIKLDEGTNASKIFSPDKKKMLNYYDEIKIFYKRFVIPSSAPDFLEIFEPYHLMMAMSEKRVVSRKFQTAPNAMGQCYFEVRATKMEESSLAFNVLFDFRHIDEIVSEEKKRQKELEIALDEAKTKNTIISALSKIYFAIYRIDIKKSYFEEISGDDMTKWKKGKVLDRLEGTGVQNISPKYRKYAVRFFDTATLNQRLREDESVAAEYMVRDGNWHLARFIVQERDTDGTVRQVLLAIRSISEEKWREKNLIEAVDDANQANEAKSDFLSRMSHDIRTPMNAIMGFTDIAQKNVDHKEKLVDCLRKIEQSGENLQQLVNDILDISRIESGEFKVSPQPVEIEKLFDFKLEEISGIASEKGIRIHARKYEMFRKILQLDPLRIGQVYMNLLSNAVKYTMKGGEVFFEMHEEKLEDAEKVRLITVIRDTGIGMSEEFMEQMYTKFSRAVDTRVNEVRGSGLGLSIVKQIVDMMDGRIEVESEPGKGTAFTIILDVPFVEEHEFEQAKTEEKEQIRLPERPMKILVAEDNELNYEILEEQLKEHKIECVHAENGLDAVQKIQRALPGEYDVILMDMQMPVMNGPDAAAAIRELDHPDARRIPIIALTANAYRRDVRKCMEAGMNAHLAKPVKMDLLLRTIAEFLAKNEK